MPPGKALPIVRARLKIGDVDEARPVMVGDKEVVFTRKLKAGTRTQMQSWFYDADGKELCGAYFAYVLRK